MGTIACTWWAIVDGQPEAAWTQDPELGGAWPYERLHALTQRASPWERSERLAGFSANDSASMVRRISANDTARRHLKPSHPRKTKGRIVGIARPFSPETLAERWGCSSDKVRRMYRAGEIEGFKLGKLIRIPAAAVERFECQTTELLPTEDLSPSSSRTPSEDAFGSRLARMTEASPRLALVTSGHTDIAPRPKG
jgi:excisionase family DNA binding protein